MALESFARPQGAKEGQSDEVAVEAEYASSFSPEEILLPFDVERWRSLSMDKLCRLAGHFAAAG